MCENDLNGRMVKKLCNAIDVKNINAEFPFFWMAHCTSYQVWPSHRICSNVPSESKSSFFVFVVWIWKIVWTWMVNFLFSPPQQTPLVISHWACWSYMIICCLMLLRSDYQQEAHIIGKAMYLLPYVSRQLANRGYPHPPFYLLKHHLPPWDC